MRVGGFLVQVCGVFIVVGPDAEDGGGDVLRDGCAASINEGGDEEGRDRDSMPILADRCVEGGSEEFYTSGVSDGCEGRP